MESVESSLKPAATRSLSGTVISVGRSPCHGFSKTPQSSIELVAGLGVEGDAHAGVTVKHRSRVAQDPTQPNLRQVHLISEELLARLAIAGFALQPGDLGENVLTSGIDLQGLPRGTVLDIGPTVKVELTGLRNPCPQIEAFRAGLLAQVLGRDENGALQRRAGVMGIVIQGGTIRISDTVTVVLPALPHIALERV